MKKIIGMEYTVVDLDSFMIIGKELRLNLADPDVPEKIKIFWETVFKDKMVEHIPVIQHPIRMVGVYTNYDNVGNYLLVIACPVTSLNSIPLGMEGYTISRSRYAVFTVKGAMPEAISKFWQKLWQGKDEFNFERIFTADFELYDQLGENDQQEVKIYIAIK